jgi:hypothetical protein
MQLWFGLGAETSATVDVLWPSGQVSSHEVAADTRVLLNEPR